MAQSMWQVREAAAADVLRKLNLDQNRCSARSTSWTTQVAQKFRKCLPHPKCHLCFHKTFFTKKNHKS